MRNRNMKNDKVVRAIALALSSVLASGAVMPAMQAYAEGNDVVVETVEETPEMVEVTEEAAQAPTLKDAKEALDEAISEEKEAAKEGLSALGSGIATAEEIAKKYDGKAADHVKEATLIISSGEVVVGEKLSDMDDQEKKLDSAIDDVDEAVKNTNTAVENTNEALADTDDEISNAEAAAKDAEAAKNAASASSTSANATVNAQKADSAVKEVENAISSAEETVAKAGEEAKKADEEATKAEDSAASALAAYVEAEKDYQDAVQKAEEAEKLANEKIAKGAEDAEVATKAAETAWKAAKALKILAQTAKDNADNKVKSASNKLDIANRELNEAIKQYNNANGVEKRAEENEQEELKKLNDAIKAFNEAQKKVNELNKTIKLDLDREEELKTLIASLEDAKKSLEEAKTSIEEELEELDTSKKSAEEAMDEQRKIGRAINKAIETINAQLTPAQSTYESLRGEANTKSEEVAKAKEEYFNEDGTLTSKGEILVLERDIADIKADENKDDAQKEAEIKVKRDELVKVVLGQELGTVDDSFELETNGTNVSVDVDENITGKIYAVSVVDAITGETSVKYYTYEVNTDDTISVYELSKEVDTTEGGKQYTDYNGLSQKEYENLVEGKVEGRDYEVTTTEVPEKETIYTVNYNVVDSGSYERDKVTKQDRDTINEYIKNGYTVTVNGRKIIGIAYQWSFKTASNRTQYQTEDGKWHNLDEKNVEGVKYTKTLSTVTDATMTQAEIDALTNAVVTSKVVKEEGTPAYKIYDVKVYESYTEKVEPEEVEGLEFDENGVYTSEDGSVVVVRTKEAGTTTISKTEHYIVFPMEEQKLKLREIENLDMLLKTGFVKGKCVNGTFREQDCEIVRDGDGDLCYRWVAPYNQREVKLIKLTEKDKDKKLSVTGQITAKSGPYATQNESLLVATMGSKTCTITTSTEVETPAEYQKTTYKVNPGNTSISYSYADEIEDANATKGYYGSLSALESGLTNLNAQVEAAKKDVDDLVEKLEEQNKKKEDAQKAYDEAKAQLYSIKKQIQVKDNEKKEVKDKIHKNNKQLEPLYKEKGQLESELEKLNKQKKKAEDELRKATDNKNEEQKKYDKVANDLKTAKDNLKKAETNKQNKEKEVENKQTAYNNAVDNQKKAEKALNYYLGLVDETRQAYEAAKAAEDLLKELKGSADVSSSLLKAAKDKLDELKSAYDKAQAAADKAREDADKALKDYEASLEEVGKLGEVLKDAKGNAATAWELVAAKKSAEEEAARLAREAANINNDTEILIGGTTIVISPAAQNDSLAQAVVGATRRVRVTTEAAVEETAEDGEAEETVAPAVATIADNDVPEAAKDTVTIGDNETALSATIPVEEKMSWWWLILVIVAGGTGLEMYRRHQAKKKAAEVKND